MEACDVWGCSELLAAARLRRHVWRNPSATLSAFASKRSPSADCGAPEGKRMFVFGMGFVGRYVAGRLREEGWWKHLNALQHATHLLISIPPISDLGDPLLFLQEGLLDMLSSGKLQWLGYLSSTSVYGDHGGAWVDEDFQAKPIVQAAKARLAAEQGWLDLGHDLGTSAYVFRLGGIYGPGRSQEALSKYQKMRRSRKYTARVHVADIYQAINASFAGPLTGRVYNVVDDDPAPRSEVFAFAEELIEEKWPGIIIKRNTPMETVEIEMREADAKAEKRVSNARLKKELGVGLIHSSYKSGLRSILDSMESSFR
ncbi:hypothetical protein Taro_015113 [Colocasia esculenta]|uniref:NAD-dependent epimerase/dehydratase domain-containing protein n=1 Tax=Colocasia esculenta TaxID=4460 RepID=A0A843UGG3_COLES|nr:hypothetical protein [Colocasia esculenta]